MDPLFKGCPCAFFILHSKMDEDVGQKIKVVFFWYNFVIFFLIFFVDTAKKSLYLF